MLRRFFLSVIGCLIVGYVMGADFLIYNGGDNIQQQIPRVAWGKKNTSLSTRTGILIAPFDISMEIQ